MHRVPVIRFAQQVSKPLIEFYDLTKQTMEIVKNNS